MFSARTPRGRLTVLGLILTSAFMTASPVFAHHHHHDDSNSSKSSSDSKSHSASGKQSSAGNSSTASHATPSKPAAPSSVPAKAAPAPAATSISPLNMTRDAATPLAPGIRVADAGKLNPAVQIFRMTGALIIVLLLLVGAAHLFRRSPLMAQMNGTSVGATDLSFQGTLKAAFSFLSPLAALSPMKRAHSRLQAKIQPAAQTTVPATPPAMSLDSGLLRLSGAQALPGSAASVYLIQVGTKGILLGTSVSGPIQVLGEFEGLDAIAAAPPTESHEGSPLESDQFSLSGYSDPAPYFASDFETMLREQEEEAAFDALMRKETPADPERGETIVVQSILDRLNQTRDRLSRRLNDETQSGEDRLSA